MKSYQILFILLIIAETVFTVLYFVKPREKKISIPEYVEPVTKEVRVPDSIAYVTERVPYPVMVKDTIIDSIAYPVVVKDTVWRVDSSYVSFFNFNRRFFEADFKVWAPCVVDSAIMDYTIYFDKWEALRRSLQPAPSKFPLYLKLAKISMGGVALAAGKERIALGTFITIDAIEAGWFLWKVR